MQIFLLETQKVNILPQSFSIAGVLGSYLATQAAARAGIGRFGPSNPRPVPAAGGYALHFIFNEAMTHHVHIKLQ